MDEDARAARVKMVSQVVRPAFIDDCDSFWAKRVVSPSARRDAYAVNCLSNEMLAAVSDAVSVLAGKAAFFQIWPVLCKIVAR
jgi:hypothetical protein